MQHPNESMLQELYARFGQGDMPGFLAGCADRVTFSVPGEAAVSGEFTKATFMDLIGRVMERSGGTFREDVLGVFANDQHGVLLLHHQFERDGKCRAYRTARIVEFVDGKIAAWREHPGSEPEFADAWGPR